MLSESTTCSWNKTHLLAKLKTSNMNTYKHNCTYAKRTGVTKWVWVVSTVSPSYHHTPITHKDVQRATSYKNKEQERRKDKKESTETLRNTCSKDRIPNLHTHIWYTPVLEKIWQRNTVQTEFGHLSTSLSLSCLCLFVCLYVSLSLSP